jgi:hypothetical protein
VPAVASSAHAATRIVVVRVLRLMDRPLIATR